MADLVEVPAKAAKKAKKKAEVKAVNAQADMPEAGQEKPSPAQKRALKRKRLAEANTQTVILETDIRKFVAAQARDAGMDMAPYLQKIIETHVINTAEAGDALGARVAAKRAVLDRVVALAREMDAAGEFDAHFIVNVVRRAGSEPAFLDAYETAIDAKNENKRAVARAQIPINQQMGRLIKRAAGAKSKRDDGGKIQRAQVQGEMISTYTLLEKPVSKN
ncbi:MAG: hypothetical protein AB3N11_12850 [Arenibacterium sp.]